MQTNTHSAQANSSNTVKSQQPKPVLDSVIIAGVVIISLFVGGFLGWSTLSPLNSAAVAPGLVAVEKGRQTVAHLEGGIVGDILVSEGEEVEEGQLLVRLSDTNAFATYELLRSRQMVARALVARLESEYEGLSAVRFPTDMNSKRGNATVNEILHGQEKIFETRSNAQKNRKAILSQRIVQLREEIVGLKGQVRAENVQLKLIGEEISMVQTMLAKGFSDKPRLLLLQRRASEVQGRRSKHKSDIARANQSIGETKLRIDDIDTSQISDVAEKLRTARADIYDLNERMRAAGDVHQRTDIVSPISGTVVGLKVHTLGGVVRPGEPLMDIVPGNERLVVEARVAPNDIDVVHKGMNAKVRLSAFSQRTILPAVGQVKSISADHLMDETTGKTYYLARILLNKNEAQPELLEKLRPGMEAEVMIVTGERTFLEYMMEPLVKSFNRSFRET